MFVSKTIKAELFGLTQIKLDKLKDLQASGKRHLSLRRITRGYDPKQDAFLLLQGFGVEAKQRLRGNLDRQGRLQARGHGKFLCQIFRPHPHTQGEDLVPLRMWDRHEALLGETEVSDSKLTCKRDRFFLHITIKREVKSMKPSGVLAWTWESTFWRRLWCCREASSAQPGSTGERLEG